MRKRIKEEYFTLICYLPFLQSDLYDKDFKLNLILEYMDRALEYSRKKL